MSKTTTKSNYKTFLPHQVLEQWEGILSRLPAEDRGRLSHIIAACLPPLARGALTHSATLVEGAEAAPFPALPEDVLDRNVGRVAESHPLFFALYGFFPRPESPAQTAVRQVLITLFADTSDESRQKPSTYYNDLLATRDILQSVLDRALLNPDQPWAANLEEALQTFWSFSAPEELVKRGPGKAERTRRLLAGEREPGVGHDRRSPEPTIQPERRIRARPNRPWRGNNTTALDQPSADGVDTDDGSWEVQGVEPEAAGDSMPVTDQLKRSQPSVLTRADDRRQARRSARLAPTDNLVAETDVQRLPPQRLAEALDHLRDRSLPQWAFATLLVTTGLPIDRLAALTRGTEIPTGSSPIWDPEKGRIRYLLRDGPAEAIDNQGRPNRMVELPLPQAINEALAVSDAHCPMRRVAQQIRDGISQGFRRSAGPTPTPQRIRATAREGIRPHTVDDIAALALGGAFNIAAAAPAAYRRFHPGELATAFRQTWWALTNRLPPSATRADVHNPAEGVTVAETPLTPGVIGSVRAREPEDYVEGFRMLQALIRDQAQGIRRDWVHGEPDPDRLLNALRLQAAHTYLAWLLGTGARPVGSGNQFVRRSDLWYLADKGSPAYRERRLIPSIPQVADQLDRHQRALSAAADLLRDGGHAVATAAPTGKQDLPGILVRQGGGFQRRTLTHKTFEEILTKHDLTEMADWARNNTRHTVATFLRRQLPDWLVHAQLGHVSQCLAPSHPARACPPPDLQATRNALSDLLHRTGFRRSDLESALHDH